MSDIKLFRLSGGAATKLQGNASDLEKPLQTLIKPNLQPLLNIRFIASEHSTGKTHGGRIDSLGLDETLSTMADLDATKPFINAAYEGRAYPLSAGGF